MKVKLFSKFREETLQQYEDRINDFIQYVDVEDIKLSTNKVKYEGIHTCTYETCTEVLVMYND